jgi:hypothetical protein
MPHSANQKPKKPKSVDLITKICPYSPWDALEAWMTLDEIRGYHKGVAISYLAREHRKGGDEDIAKAIHHLTALMDLLRG